jgi:hypothetical protein
MKLPYRQHRLLPARASGAIICQMTVTLAGRPIMSFSGDSEPSQFRGGRAYRALRLAPTPQAAPSQLPASPARANQAAPAQGFPSSPASHQVMFDRAELGRIFDLYGRKVATGEWRDYAIDFLKDRAVFSVFRRACEAPLYRIEKSSRLTRRQGMYSVISSTGLIMRRGHELERVLRVIDKSLSLVAG